MGLLDRNHIDITLTLHNGIEYVPGDSISGLVEVIVKKEISWRSICLRIRGEEHAKVFMDNTWQANSRMHYDKVYLFAGSPRHSRGDGSLCPPIMIGGDSTTPRTRRERSSRSTNSAGSHTAERKLQPGAYRYPFDVKLPLNLPPSFEVRTRFELGEASLVYTVTACVEIPHALHAEVERVVYLLSSIPHAQYLELTKPEETTRAAGQTDALTVDVTSSRTKVPPRVLPRICRGAREREYINTEAKVTPLAIVMQTPPRVSSPIQTGFGHFPIEKTAPMSPTPSQGTRHVMRVYVRVVNTSRRRIPCTRVQMKNIVHITPRQHTRTREVTLGDPFLHKDAIAPGEETCFVAIMEMEPLVPYAALDAQRAKQERTALFETGDPKKLAAVSNLPQRRRKRRALHLQPLVTLHTAFVTSRCVLCVDFPDLQLSGNMAMANELLLMDSVNTHEGIPRQPCVHISHATEAHPTGRSLSNALLVESREFVGGAEEGRPGAATERIISPRGSSGSSRWFLGNRDGTGIFPAYTAGKLSPRSTDLQAMCTNWNDPVALL